MRPSEIESSVGHKHWLSLYLGVILFWTSFAMAVLTCVAMYVGLSMEPSGVGDMRRFAQLVLVLFAGVAGFGISAAVAFIASFYERAAGTLLVLELALFGLCLLPIVVIVLAG